MLDIFLQAINSISSVEKYYDFEIDTIRVKSKQEMEKSQLGAMLYLYLSLKIYSKDDAEDELFEKINSLTNNAIEDLEISEGKATFSINEEKISMSGRDIHKQVSSFMQFIEMPKILSESTLIMAVTRFEEFISGILKFIFDRYPEKYLNDKTITYKEYITTSGSDIKERIINNEVDKIMRASYSEWFKLLKEHGISIEKYKSLYDNLTEIYARRNIVVHNRSVVNNSYISMVSKTAYKEGDILHIRKEYLDNTFLTLKAIVCLIVIEAIHLYKQESKEFKSNYLEDVFSVAYAQMEDGEYALSKIIFNELKERKELDAQLKLLSKINYWLSCKNNNEWDLVKDEVYVFDISAYSKQFCLAKMLLTDNFEEADELLKELLKTEELNTYYIEVWPILKEYRKTEYYDKLKEEFAEKFGVVEIDVDDIQEKEGLLEAIEKENIGDVNLNE